MLRFYFLVTFFNQYFCWEDQHQHVASATPFRQRQSYWVTLSSMIHLLTRCRGTAEIRTKITSDLLNTIAEHFPFNGLLNNHPHDRLTQFILDPTSINLPMTIRIPPDHPALLAILQACRKLCYSVHRDRNLKLHNKTHQWHTPFTWGQPSSSNM